MAKGSVGAQTSSLIEMQAGGLRYFARSLDRQWFKAEQWLPMSRHETSCCTLSEKTIPVRHVFKPGRNKIAPLHPRLPRSSG